FVLLAAAAGIYGVRQVGQSLDTVDARIAPTLAAIELSRSAERLVAAAPPLVAAADAKQRDEARTRLPTESAAAAAIVSAAAALTGNLAALESVAERRLEAAERVRALREGVLRVNEHTQSLLVSWLVATDSELAFLAAEARRTAGGGEAALRLGDLARSRSPAETARRQLSAVYE